MSHDEGGSGFAWFLAGLGIGAVVGVLYAPKSGNETRQEILNKASAYSVHVREDDISITTTGAVFRVAVDYRVPIDLFVYSRELRFQTIGSGLLRE